MSNTHGLKIALNNKTDCRYSVSTSVSIFRYGYGLKGLSVPNLIITCCWLRILKDISQPPPPFLPLTKQSVQTPLFNCVVSLWGQRTVSGVTVSRPLFSVNQFVFFCPLINHNCFSECYTIIWPRSGDNVIISGSDVHSTAYIGS